MYSFQLTILSHLSPLSPLYWGQAYVCHLVWCLSPWIYSSCSKTYRKSPALWRAFTAPLTLHVCLVKLLQSCLTLCDPIDCSHPGSFVHGILQARILELFPMPSSRNLLDSGTEPISLTFPALAGKFFTSSATWETPALRLATFKWFSFPSNIDSFLKFPN